MTNQKLTGLAFNGQWRHYQELALDSFERDRAAGRSQTYIVAPPGSGKTVLGIEIMRRVGGPAVVLAPNSAIQAQWFKVAGSFNNGQSELTDLISMEPNAGISCLTYQALCQLQDPEGALNDAALAIWASERAKATGQSVAAVQADVSTWQGEAAKRHKSDLTRITANLKRDVARGNSEIDFITLLGASARKRIDTLRQFGITTVVLDECHHLASLWGYIIRAFLSELSDVHVIGLTATPPEELTQDEAELYTGLLGDADFIVPTPAVVRDGFLAPYQELAWLTEPLDSEKDWLAAHNERFQELVTDLCDTDDHASGLAFPEWVITRLRYRESKDGTAEVPWERFQRSNPKLAQAGVRFLASAGLSLPPGAPRGERFRQPPDLEDWLVLLEDYALRCLVPDPSERAAERYDQISRALRDLGFQLTRRGLRRGRSEIDTLLTHSYSKTLALIEVLACELNARADTLRSLVLVDTELGWKQRDPTLDTVVYKDAGSARQILKSLVSDIRTEILSPLIVTGKGVIGAKQGAEKILAEFKSLAEGSIKETLRIEPLADDPELVSFTATDAEWKPRRWVRLATELLASGEVAVLIGTRALLGEGWDAPAVNVFVDMTSATTAVAVRQMRGRSLRLNPNEPEKLSSNWDIVCAAPELARGDIDYRRFVRKHLHLLAPAEDGVIEAGPSHVHPELSTFAPPVAAHFADINRAMKERVARRSEARELWQIGKPYAAIEQATLITRARNGSCQTLAKNNKPPTYPVSQRLPLGTAAVLGAAGPALLVAGASPDALLLAATTPIPLAAASVRLGKVRKQLHPVAPLDLIANAVTETYYRLGEFSEEAVTSLAIEPRPAGYMRCSLTKATVKESELFTAAMQTLLGPIETPRYLVSRLIADPQVGGVRLLGRVLRRQNPFTARWHAVPADLARKKERAEVFRLAWERWLGPAELTFTQRSDNGRKLLAEAVAQDWDYDAQNRTIWI